MFPSFPTMMAGAIKNSSRQNVARNRCAKQIRKEQRYLHTNKEYDTINRLGGVLAAGYISVILLGWGGKLNWIACKKKEKRSLLLTWAARMFGIRSIQSNPKILDDTCRLTILIRNEASSANRYGWQSTQKWTDL